MQSVLIQRRSLGGLLTFGLGAGVLGLPGP